MYDIFKCIFINENHYSLIDISMFFSKGSDQQYASIGSDNDLAPNWWQATIWINDQSPTCYF